MFKADVISADGNVVVPHADVECKRFLRGEGGPIWRGFLRLPPETSQHVKSGDALYLLLPDRSRIGTVVTEVARPFVHFRARGKMPD